MDPDQVEALLPQLESEDAFERLAAGRALPAVARADFGYRWDAPEGERKAAVARLRSAITAARARAAGAPAAPWGTPPTAEEVAALAGVPPAIVHSHMEVLAALSRSVEAAARRRPVCSWCEGRPHTVVVLDVEGFRATALHRLCEPCAAERGEADPAGPRRGARRRGRRRPPAGDSAPPDAG